ncbi:hypothetical protein [Prochlorococcus marinus]
MPRAKPIADALNHDPEHCDQALSDLLTCFADGPAGSWIISKAQIP